MYSLDITPTLRLRWVVLSAIALGMMQPVCAEHKGHTLRVATFGVDSASCGTRANPCRTIRHAIGLAADGDTVLVGPGLYGDLNSDTDETDPGEEGSLPSDSCVVCIRKRLAVYSTDGPLATVIRTLRRRAVEISADGTVFGARNHGFMLAGSVVVERAANVRVVGNVLFRDVLGINAERGPVHASANTVVGASIAIVVDSQPGHPGHAIVKGNVVFGCSDIGMVVDGPVPHVIVGNSVAGCFSRGLQIRNDSRVRGNTAVGNAIGVFVEGSGHPPFNVFAAQGVRIHDNLVVGNHAHGMFFEPTSAAPDHQVHRNEIVGNGIEPATDINGFPIPLNCGIVNQSGGPVDATDNFWGSPNGPGPDPADNAGPGSGCDLQGTTQVRPFAATPDELR
jgi:hypothetical protein